MTRRKDSGGKVKIVHVCREMLIPEPMFDNLKAERNSVISLLVIILISVIGFFFRLQLDRISTLEDKTAKQQDHVTIIETVLKQAPALRFPAN
jgi:hypothetical protein